MKHNKIIILILILTTFISACKEAPNRQTQSTTIKQNKNTRIVGGQPAEDKWQWMVALIDKSTEFVNPFCGGTLVAPSWVVTAAHCVSHDSVSTLEIFAGSSDLNDETGQRIPIKQIVMHPDYDPETEDSDIALLELSTSLDNYRTLSVLPVDYEVDGMDGTIMGWGRVGEYLSTSDVLLQATIPIVTNETCVSVFGDDLITDNMICAGDVYGEKDSCYGDSGGPLMVYTQGNYYLAGIVSWGEGCGRNGFYGVYTRVSKFYSFIQNCVSQVSWVSEIKAQVSGEIQKQISIGTSYYGSSTSTPSHATTILDFDIVKDASSYIRMIYPAQTTKLYTWVTKLDYKPVSKNPLIEISWSADTFHTQGRYVLIAGNTINGEILIDDMRHTTNFEFIHLKQKNYFTICWVVDPQTEISLQQGWNLISFPFIPLKSALFYKDKLAYEYNSGRYLQVKNFAPGKGYWMYSDKEEHLSINRIPFESFSKDLSAGWHLLGSINWRSILSSYPDDSIESIVNWHDGAYHTCNNNFITPGYGYWIKLKNACRLSWTPLVNEKLTQEAL